MQTIDVEKLRRAKDVIPTNTLSILVENKPGVLSRVAGLISRRSYNIESLTVSTTQSDKISRISIVVKGDPVLVKQISGQLAKLINVIHIDILNADNSIDTEAIFAKVNIDGVDKNGVSLRTTMLEIASAFGAKVVDVHNGVMIMKAVGGHKKMDSLISELKNYPLQEVVRSGTVVIGLGENNLDHIFGE